MHNKKFNCQYVYYCEDNNDVDVDDCGDDDQTSQ